MGVYIDDIKLVIIKESKIICFDLSKEIDNSLKDEIISILLKQNKVLAEHRMENKISQLLSKYKHGNDIHEHEKH